MATILTKRSNTASSVPVAGDLTNSTSGAELAVNTADKRLFVKDSGGTVVELGTNPSAFSNNPTFSAGNANGVAYLNGSKVLTTGSALTFDGTTSFALKQNTGGTGNYSELVLDITNSFSGTGKSYLRNISLNGGNSSTALAFGVNADGGGAPSEQMRLTSTGLVIGGTSPTGKLKVQGSVGSFYIDAGATGLAFTYNGLNYISALGGSSAGLVFETGGAIERMRLDSSGNLLAGTTSSGVYNGVVARIEAVTSTSGHSAGSFKNATAGQQTISVWNATDSGTRYFLEFSDGSTRSTRGSITSNGTSTAYNTSSDYRLKEDIQPMTGALAFVRKQRPVTYRWRADGSEGSGYIAHWLQEDGAGQCVTGNKDAVDADGKAVYQSIDTSFMVSPLNAALNELADIVDAQAAIIESLKARLDAANL